MGLKSFITKQFIDVIEWTDTEQGVLISRYPMQDREIQNGASLTVRESQKAVFMNEGKIADVFGPGRYTLNTQTLPILTYLRNWDKAFKSPFKSDIYFVNMREQIDQRWGTAQPITLRDKEFGIIRLRANGAFSYQIKDIEPFWLKLSGTLEKYTTEDIAGQLSAIIMTSLATFLGHSDVPFLDMAANQNAFSEKLKSAVAPALALYGLDLRTFFVQSLSLPEEVQAHLDKVSSMRAVGDLNKYVQYQTADSISLAAVNPGGAAGAGVGIGAGVAMGQMMGGALNNPAANAAGAAAAADPIAMLEKLGELVKKGVLTQAEFDAKKAELLQKIK
jgi:membrane protease subunit (stomatin/prohibitin family)